MSHIVDCPYILLVHTDSYAGNFERQMCAYMTGIVGECEVGSHQADLFEEDMEERGLDPDMFGASISQQSDEHGIQRPCSIWNAEGESGYKTVAIFFDSLPSADETVILRDRAYDYAKMKGLTVNKLTLIKRKVVVRETQITEISKTEI